MSISEKTRVTEELKEIEHNKRGEYYPYVTTYSGKKIHIHAPAPHEICLEDIVHQTAMKVRFGGAVEEFYSVAQHSVYCSHAASKMDLNLPTRLAVLLHDANEGPYPDIQRPIKMYLPSWKLVEDPLEHAIYNKYLGKYINDVDWKALKKIDNILLVYEGRVLLQDASWTYDDHWKDHFEDTPFGWDGIIDDVYSYHMCWSWAAAKARFYKELDSISQLMVDLDPEWTTVSKELQGWKGKPLTRRWAI